MIMGTTTRWESLGIVKNKVVLGEDKLQVKRNSGGGNLNYLNGMELDSIMTLFVVPEFML
jgi:hypothetical protein